MSGQTAHVSGRPEPFRLLFVCAGNVCCSPFAQLHTRALLDVRLGPGWARWFSVASAGTAAVAGSLMHPGTRAFFGTRAGHADVEAFRARRLPARDVRLADLVLTADRRGRSAVVDLEPRALRTTFTVRELARLLAVLDPSALPRDPLSRARALVPAAGDLRGLVPPVPAAEDALPDPAGGGPADHAAVTRTIDAAVRALVAAVAGDPIPSAPPTITPSGPRRPAASPGPSPGPSGGPLAGSVQVGPIRLGPGGRATPRRHSDPAVGDREARDAPSVTSEAAVR